MATQQLGLDASNYFEQVRKIIAQLREHKVALEDLTVEVIKFNKDGKLIEATYKGLTAAGEILSGSLKGTKKAVLETGEGYKILKEQIRQASAVQAEFAGRQQAVKDQVKKQAAEAKKTEQLQTVATSAKDFFGKLPFDTKELSANQLSQLRTVQNQIIQALLKDPKQVSALPELLQRLKDGFLDLEVGVRGKLQQALLGLLRVEQQITKETKDQKDNKTASANTTDKEKAKKERFEIGRQVSDFAGQRLPIPAGASVSSIITFQNALERLKSTAATSKAPLDQLQQLFLKVKADPTKDFAGSDARLSSVQTAIRQVIAAYQQLQKTAEQSSKEAEKGAGRLLISFSSLIRILEIQVVHRFFGAFLTGIQSSIGAAAELQTKIAEILTITQKTDLNNNDLTQLVRNLSEGFNRSQIDVAEAVYQGFSNQVVKSREDLVLFNEALRLSRITSASATQGVNALSSVLNAYRLPATEAKRVSDTLFRAVEIGRFRLGDIADTMGRVNVASAQVGISFQEFAAVLALVTKNGVPVSEAMTQISSFIQALLRPTPELTRLFNELGFASAKQAIEILKLGGVFRILSQEADKGGNRLGELEHNVRALRLTFATSGVGVEEFADVLNQVSAGGTAFADAAENIIKNNPGEQFKNELLKIQNFFTADFGTNIVEFITRITQPFGGFSNLVKQLGESFQLILGPIKIFLELVANLVTLGGQFGGVLRNIVLLLGAYKIATVALSAAQSAKLGIMNSVILSEIRLVGQLKATEVALISQGKVTEALGVQQLIASTRANIFATALRGVGTALLGIGLVGAPLLISLFEDDIRGFFRPQDVIAGEIEKFQERLKKLQEESLREQTRRDSDATQQFRQDVDERFRPYQLRVAEVNRLLNQFVAGQRTRVKELNDELKANAQVISDSIGNIVSKLRSSISEAENAIKQSRKNIQRFSTRDQADFFREAFSLTEKNNKGLDINFTADRQLSLIRDRKTQLEREISELNRSTNVEAIEEVRKRFEEIRRLTIQQFNIELDRRRTLVEEGRASPDSTIFNPQTGENVRAVIADLGGLRRSLDSITSAERAAESQFQRIQQRQIEVNREILEFERRRQQTITLSLRNLTEFTLLNEQGQLRNEFRGTGGVQRAISEFQRLSQDVQNRIQTVQLTDQDFASLVQRFGRADAEIIRNRLQQNQIGAEEIRRINESIANSRRAIEAQADREITAQRARELTERITQERQNLIRLREEAVRERQRGTTAQDTDLQRITQEIRNTLPSVAAERPNRGNAFEAFGSVARANALNRQLSDRVESTGRAAMDAIIQFTQNRTQENQDRVTELIAEYQTAVRGYLRRVFGDRQVGTSGLTGEQIASNIDTGINALLNRFTNAGAQITQANERIAETQRQLGLVNQQVAQLPANLAAIVGVGNQVADAIDRSLGRTADRLGDIARQIELLILRVGQFNAVTPIAPVPLGTLGAIQGTAEGGLLGNTFSNRGPDNMLAAVRTGEFVVNPESTRKFYTQLVAINSGRLPHFEHGGMVTNNTVGDVTINVSGNGSPEQTARRVMAQFRRETRRGSGSI